MLCGVAAYGGSTIRLIDGDEIRFPCDSNGTAAIAWASNYPCHPGAMAAAAPRCSSVFGIQVLDITAATFARVKVGEAGKFGLESGDTCIREANMDTIPIASAPGVFDTHCLCGFSDDITAGRKVSSCPGGPTASATCPHPTEAARDRFGLHVIHHREFAKRLESSDVC